MQQLQDRLNAWQKALKARGVGRRLVHVAWWGLMVRGQGGLRGVDVRRQGCATGQAGTQEWRVCFGRRACVPRPPKLQTGPPAL